METITQISILGPQKPEFFPTAVRWLYEGLQKKCDITLECFTLKKRDILKRLLFKPRDRVYFVFHPGWVKYTKCAVVQYDDPLSLLYPEYASVEREILNQEKVAFVLTVTPQLKKYLESIGIDGKKIKVLPFPVDYDLFAPSNNDDGNTVGFLGWTYENRLKFLKTVVKNLPDNIRFITNDKLILQGLPTNKSNVSILHRVPSSNLRKLVEYTNMLTIGLTYFDGGRFSSKILQYMACEKPVIANNVPENHVIVESGAGFLVDSPEDAVEHIVLLLKDEKLRKEMGRKGREYVQQNYNKFKIADQYINIFREASKRLQGFAD